MGGVREEKGGEGGQGRVSDNMCNGQRYKKKKLWRLMCVAPVVVEG